MSLPLDDDPGGDTVVVTDPTGKPVGQVNIGDETQGQLPGGSKLNITSSAVDNTSRQISSDAIISVTLYDERGVEIPLVGEVELCFTSTSNEDQCLGFLNDKGEWECEDPCLESKDGQLCGRTGHFTNFALLLGGGGGGCNSDIDYTITYLSAAFIISACLCVFLAAILIEIRVRRTRRTKTKKRAVRVTMVD